VTAAEAEPRHVLSEAEIDTRMVDIEKGQNLGFHYPDADALGRARRILTGEITLEEAHAEIMEKYAEPEE
jgi:hypothetical protein